jgi:DNA-binding NarL/FixJ family response regulator
MGRDGSRSGGQRRRGPPHEPQPARHAGEVSEMTLRILLVDDHAIVRQGVRQLLLNHGVAREVVEAETGAQALASLDGGPFDIILLDISLPDMNGVEVLKRTKRRAPRTPVMMFSMYREDQYAVRSLKAGAAGYLSKTVTAAQMIEAIRQVAAGRKYVSPALAEALADYVSFDSDQLPHEKLSDREYQTLCMLASGKRLTDIAHALSLSVKTVSVYRARLLEKMKLRNNAELTFYVMSNRLVDLNPAMTG